MSKWNIVTTIVFKSLDERNAIRKQTREDETEKILKRCGKSGNTQENGFFREWSG